MTAMLKPTATGAGPATTADTHKFRPTGTTTARRIAYRLEVALVAIPVFYGFAAQPLTLAQLLGAYA